MEEYLHTQKHESVSIFLFDLHWMNIQVGVCQRESLYLHDINAELTHYPDISLYSVCIHLRGNRKWNVEYGTIVVYMCQTDFTFNRL